MNTTAIGNSGEELAAQALERNGYEILQRNWKTPACEIDIVARRGGTIFFTEVKYRTHSLQGDGFAYITPSKLRHMQRAAQIWIANQRWNGECCLLAVSVVGQTGAVDIREL